MVNSLNTNAQVFGPPRLLPQSWRWQNYEEIFQKQPFARHYANTLLVAGVGTLGNVLISALSGYGFARVRFPGRGILFILLLTALMMPVEVIIIPLFYQMKDVYKRQAAARPPAKAKAGTARLAAYGEKPTGAGYAFSC